MRKDLLILLAVLIPSAIVMLVIASNFSNKKINNLFTSPTPFPVVSVNPTVSQNPEVISPAASRNIEVLSPRGGDFVKSGFRVMGNARVFENVVSIRLTDSEGNVLVQTTASANASDVGQFGPFEKVLNYQTSATEGTLEVYQVSAKDGSEIDKVVVPILFR